MIHLAHLSSNTLRDLQLIEYEQRAQCDRTATLYSTVWILRYTAENPHCMECRLRILIFREYLICLEEIVLAFKAYSSLRSI